MSLHPESFAAIEAPDAPANAAQFAEMVKGKPEQWYIYVDRVLREFRETQQFADSLVEEQNNLQERLKELQQQLNQANHEGRLLQEQLDEARRHQTGPPTLTSQPDRMTKSEKIPDPEPFDGKRSELAPFIASLRLKLLMNRDRFPTVQERLTYAFSRLAGNARNQILPYVTATGIGLEDEEALIAHLELAFGDPDRKGTAQRCIQTLRQKNREFSVYFAEFNRHVQDTGYNDEAKKSALMAGLSDELKALLIHTDTQEMNVQELAAHCQKLDSRYRANLAASSHTARPRLFQRQGPLAFRPAPITPSPTQSFAQLPFVSPMTPRPQPAVSPPIGEPMDLSAAETRPRAPLSAEEKQRRREMGLCLYCGLPNHVAAACPSKPKSFLRTFSLDGQSPAATPKPADTTASGNAPSLG
jgi:uncharacterized protein DUF4939